jgi:hypothetical protein
MTLLESFRAECLKYEKTTSFHVLCTSIFTNRSAIIPCYRRRRSINPQHIQKALQRTYSQTLFPFKTSKDFRVQDTIGEVTPVNTMKAYSGSKGRHIQLHTFLTSTLDGGKAPQYVYKRMDFIPSAIFH